MTENRINPENPLCKVDTSLEFLKLALSSHPELTDEVIERILKASELESYPLKYYSDTYNLFFEFYEKYFNG